MALPWVLDQLEEYARYELCQKRVTEAGCVRMLRRHVYLDEALAGQVVTCYETLNGLEARSSDQRVDMFRDDHKWYKR